MRYNLKPQFGSFALLPQKKLPSPGTRLKHGAKRREKVSWKENELVYVQKLSERVFDFFILIDKVIH
jgi:hypothetical protein